MIFTTTPNDFRDFGLDPEAQSLEVSALLKVWPQFGGSPVQCHSLLGDLAELNNNTPFTVGDNNQQL